MDEYVHIYKIPRSQVQQVEASCDSRTESFLENRQSRHDYEPVTFTQGASDTNQYPQVNDSNMVQTASTKEKDAKQQIRRLFCMFIIIGIVTLAAVMILVAVSVSIIAIRSNALSDQVAELQQQLQEINSVQVKDNRYRRLGFDCEILMIVNCEFF